jgi:glyoxylase-like metal-dependent hydrolase (beta-lactamase superfamily II)
MINSFRFPMFGCREMSPIDQVIAILDGLWSFQSELPGPRHPCNGYVILSGEKLYLIDPPADLTRESVLSVTGHCDIAHIFLTHVQEEHGAGIANFPEATAHVPVGDEYLCRGAAAYKKLVTPWGEPWEWETRGNFQGHLAGARNERPLAAAATLGASLKGGENLFGFEILATPGHGKNAVTLLTTIDGRSVAFCGDLIYGEGQMWNWFDADWDYGLQGGQHLLRRSAQALARLSPDLLCPAHGPVLNDPAQSLALLDSHLAAVLAMSDGEETQALNFVAKESPAPGWREITPHIHVCGHGSALLDPMPYLQTARAGWDERLDGLAKLNPRSSTGLFFNPFL